MFRKLIEPDNADAAHAAHSGMVRVLVTGAGASKPVEVLLKPGESAAAAALLAGLITTRTHPVSDVPRAPYCMMGVCFECLMVIDGIPSRQACLVPVRENMQIKIQMSIPTICAPVATLVNSDVAE